MKDKSKVIRKIYEVLDGYFGDLKWWPAESPFEVIVGAILTQNTSWKNVEKAINNLKTAYLLCPKKISCIDTRRLGQFIRPSGYYNIKAERLKAISQFLIDECGARLQLLKGQNTSNLREKLLSVKGVGPETADSILVYALDKPVFVVDLYTKRIFSRHGIAAKDSSYEDTQKLVHENFPRKRGMLNQFHALLVETAKEFCKKEKPLCSKCPLKGLLPSGNSPDYSD